MADKHYETFTIMRIFIGLRIDVIPQSPTEQRALLKEKGIVFCDKCNYAQPIEFKVCKKCNNYIIL